MIRRRRLKSLAILALLPLFGVIFWLSAVVASSIPNVLVIAVNVHGVNLTSFAGDSSRPHAPLSLQVLTDAQQDSTNGGGAGVPTATATPSRGIGSGPSPTPSPSPSASPLPLPTPTSPLPSPTPTATAAPATIAGQVLDSLTKLPIAGATVSLSPTGATALTDANGNFSFGVAAGTYTVTASAVDYNSASQTVTLNNGQKVNVNFRLVSITSFGSLNGTVTDGATKAPIAGATVTLSDGMIRTTDSNGNFSYSIVLNGTYTLTVSAPGYVTQSQAVTIRAGHTTNVQIALVHS
jgi:carboxypeptidase family protein